ncbi:hypothetical protein SAY87_026261 [Trapa incisa]|uniref:START domain-containing protein n=1 Tax=Trapa incisa TaxID=236973 RepID=A0AAN7GZ95_9MYRT|nr:hypothetical protein SAY87_026261 [Trapa incisa]
MVAVFALLAWITSTIRFGAVTWKVGRFRVVPGFISWHLQIGLPSILSAFERVIGFFCITSSMKSAEPSVVVVGSKPATCDNICSLSSLLITPSQYDSPSLCESDLKELVNLINEREDGPRWNLMMERSNAALSFQAWCRESSIGPMQCRTQTVFENTPPEILRDFYWDDEFRTKWDKMLVYYKTLYVCPQTGTMVVHWIRKLPIIDSKKEYIIVRRIWECDSNYYCITKGASHPSLPKSTSSRPVELYYSSWYIRSVKSRNAEEVTTSEVLLFHWEDLGIPRDLMKMATRAGMWGLVKRMHADLQAYKDLHQGNMYSPSTYSLLARITTKFELLPDMKSAHLQEETSTITERNEEGREQNKGRGTVKWFVVGGLIVASWVTLKRKGVGALCEVAKCLQTTWPKRRLGECH